MVHLIIQRNLKRERVFKEDASSTIAQSCCLCLFGHCFDAPLLAARDDIIICQLVMRYLARWKALVSLCCPQYMFCIYLDSDINAFLTSQL